MKTEDSNTGKGCVSGCAAGCLVVLLLCGIVAGALFFVAKGQYDAFIARFEREGYVQVRERHIQIVEVADKPTVYMGQTAEIKNGSDRGIAMLCQTADVHGHVKGNVHFIGQELTIHEDAILMYDLDVKAQTLNMYGIVKGKVTGSYVMNKKPPSSD